MDREELKGLQAAIGAYGLWGLLTLYWKQLSGLDPVGLIAWRILFATIVMAVIIRLTHRVDVLIRAFKEPATLSKVALCAFLIVLNWLGYVYAVVNDRVLETALGYFLAPLGAMALGVFVLGEKLTSLKRFSILLAALAVVILTISYGRLPWVAALLAVTWAIYGLVKRFVPLDPLASLSGELFVLLLPGLGFLAFDLSSQAGVAASATSYQWPFLLGTGFITVTPLLLFAYAAKRLRFTILGPVNYMVPLINFTLGWLVFKEELPASRAIGFLLVWCALVAVTVDTWRLRNTSV